MKLVENNMSFFSEHQFNEQKKETINMMSAFPHKILLMTEDGKNFTKNLMKIREFNHTLSESKN